MRYMPSCPEGYYEKVAMRWMTSAELIAATGLTSCASDAQAREWGVRNLRYHFRTVTVPNVVRASRTLFPSISCSSRSLIL